MFKRVFILGCLLLSGCLSTSPKPVSSPTYFHNSSSTPVRIEFTTPSATPHAPTQTIIPLTILPVRTVSPLNRIPTAVTVDSPTAIPTTLPFHDCDRTPGIPDCDFTAPHMVGHLAYYDAEQSHLIGLDLQTGQGWSVAIPEPRGLEWSPDGSRLLVRMNFPKEEPRIFQYVLFDWQGTLIKQFTRDQSLAWQPQGAELRAYPEVKMIRSPEGAEAWLENENMDKPLHFRTAGTANWKIDMLDIRPKEYGSSLYGWIPGTSNILITNGSGSVMNYDRSGLDFYLFNAQTEDLIYLNLHGHLEPQMMALQGSNMALIQLYMGTGNDTLAILNGKTEKISYPLPFTVDKIPAFSIRQMAWQPRQGEQEGLFALMVDVKPSNQTDQPASPLFPKSGIYLYDWISNQTRLLHETPENSLGGSFYWTTDGQYLLYRVGPYQSSQSNQTGLYVRQIYSGKEWLLLDHLKNPVVSNAGIYWNLMAIYMK